MIARQPVGQLWLAGVIPGLMMAGLFVVYIVVRCRLQPELGPSLPEKSATVRWGEAALLRAGLLPLVIFCSMMVPVHQWLDQPGGKLCHGRHGQPLLARFSSAA